MKLKLTLNRATQPDDDIVITTDAAASVSDIASTIARVDPVRAGAIADDRPLTLRAALPGRDEWLVLQPDAAIGEAWVGSGAKVELADAGVYFSANGAGDSPQVARVRVLSGPDVGKEFALREGSTTLGRDSSCDVVLNDPLVSKRHVRLEVSNVVEVVDLGSANGVVVDGGLVPRLVVAESEVVMVGDSELQITVAESVASKGLVQRPGPVMFNRSPRVETRYPGRTFSAPEVPSEKDDATFPWLAMVAPVLLGVSMWLIFDRPAALLFVLMSPMMLIGNYFMNKSKNKRSLKKAIAKFDMHLETLSEQLAAEKVTERAARLAESPSTAEMLDQAMRRGPLTWTRRAEHWSFLNIRLGVGTMRSRNVVDSASRGDLLPEFQERLDVVISDHERVSGVPIVDNLFDSGALGVAGELADTVGAVNGLVVQLTALHSPAELVVAALVTPQWSRELGWLKWMPHTSSPQSPLEGSHLADSSSSSVVLLSALEEVVDQRLKDAKARRRGAMEQRRAALERGAEVGENASEEGTKSPVPAIVVLISNDVAVDRARIVQLAERGADAGVFPVWMATTVNELPAVCRTYLHVLADAPYATAGLVRLGEVITDVEVELVGADAALEFARRMAPVVDAGAVVVDDSDLPRSISLVTVLGHELVEASDAVVDRWRQNESIHDRTPGVSPSKRRPGKLRATVGSAGIDSMHLDLRTQGPHALVGGTTGSGKSEFLQAWVLGMAAEYSPDRVSFLFIDYKGGAAFADCVSLPHCVGLVTDLSPHLVRRALTSLRAELHFREHLLVRKKAKDLLELEKRGDPESPPALVLVIDEFAALVGEVPEFVDGVVDIAQRGRSLGIHLIMATQRPAGVIKDNLRANTNLRVALRMADESDSSDVIGTKSAAHFDPSIPGRGIAKTGPGRLQQFQSGYAGGWTSREPERPSVDVAELRFGGDAPWEEPRVAAVEESRDLGPTDQQRLVSSIVAAASSANIPAPRRPWLDEIASVYDLSLLRQRTDRELLIGVADLPTKQQQLPVYFLPDVDGHIAIYGTGGSGKSTALRTLANAAAITPRGGPVEVYGLDFSTGSLRMLESLPHVGSIINGDDSERVIRLFRYLKAQLESRAPRYAAANASSITDYRTLANSPAERRVLLLIDGFPSFREDWEVASGRSVWYDVFKDILSDGRQLGIHVAFTADRPGAVPSSVGASIQRRVILRLADDTGYSLLDAPSDILSASSPPGRAIVDGRETQVAVLGGSVSMTEQSAAAEKLAQSMLRAGVTPVDPIRALPKEYSASSLPDRVDTKVTLGVSDEALEAVGLEPAGTLLISGPPASGRSNALQWLACSVARYDTTARRYYLGNARSGLAGALEWTSAATTVEQVAALAKDLSAAVSDPETEGTISVFIENISDFLQTPADAAIVELVKAVKRSEHLLVAEAETTSWNASWPLFAEIKNARRGLLLQPDSIEGDILLKTPLPRGSRSEFPAGRGMFIARGKVSRVQLPLL
ncbi:FtsK/SpoIIIE domain-containing protein [Salinibacterium sp. NK8237]|uniref:FtsK/SpoIIIE domain-containing protein n=1 Tax=Salinibacterium sp. NK8237 TaxID=2792038 RepID=UPI0018CFD222|nr:FtsK/SpoIIIE domain-containing protein [Salinibacterium sp. NK8237]MBH0129514.1 FHA domain-containing protein [Salinibacterium sp. NK8237]